WLGPCVGGEVRLRSRHARWSGSCGAPGPCLLQGLLRLFPGLHSRLPSTDHDSTDHDSIDWGSPCSYSSLPSHSRAHFSERPRKVRLYGAFAEPSGCGNLAQLLLLDVAQQENRALPFAEAGDCL